MCTENIPNSSLIWQISPHWKDFIAIMADYLSSTLCQITWQLIWLPLQTHVTNVVFCSAYIKRRHKSPRPKPLCLFWNTPYCSSDGLLTPHASSASKLLWHHWIKYYRNHRLRGFCWRFCRSWRYRAYKLLKNMMLMLSFTCIAQKIMKSHIYHFQMILNTNSGFRWTYDISRR